MLYQFLLTFTPTDGAAQATYVAHPLYGDNLSVVIERKSGEWYYTRRLDGSLTFVREDYKYIMSRPFDGSFALEIRESHDSGANWYTYFLGNFSRASLIIDQDNLNAVLEGLQEDIYDVIDNGKSETYDLCKLLPDSSFREVHGKVPPALAMIDFRSPSINFSDMYSGGALTAGGLKDNDSGFQENFIIASNSLWNFMGIFGECNVTMKDESHSANGHYSGTLHYATRTTTGTVTVSRQSIVGNMYSPANYRLNIDFFPYRYASGDVRIFHQFTLYDPNGTIVDYDMEVSGQIASVGSSPASLYFEDDLDIYSTAKIEAVFHYAIAMLLSSSPNGAHPNPLNTGKYYQSAQAFEGSGLTISTSTRTSDQPNGHRIVPGTLSRYFDAPDSDPDWIPLAENNWNYASLWYKITPSVQNGLLNQDNFNAVSWTKCWTIGTCIAALLDKISHGDIIFQETPFYSQFLYNTINPVLAHEQFSYLVTQKSNVMSPNAAGATQCNVALNWFLELLRNAFNCYWFLERRNDGKYDFHVEHVEYFRRGGSYDGSLSAQIDLTAIKPLRNFLENSTPAKRLSDQTNRYSYNLDDMSEKYTFAWQGDGGGQDFKGNPMFFKAGWIQRAKSESHEVDNIFADLGWLMLNSGTDADSSKNHEGLFIFGAYKADTSIPVIENSHPSTRALTLSSGRNIYSSIDIILTAPQGSEMSLRIYRPDQQQQIQTLETFTGTGTSQVISINYESAFIAPRVLIFDFGVSFASVTVHRIHAHESYTYYVANVQNMLRPGSYLQNGTLAWPWLQNEHLHYDIPAQKWSYDSDDILDASFLQNGTIKMSKVQSIGVCPFLDSDPDTSKGIKTGLGIGIINSASVNLSSRNVTFELIYDIN